MRPTNMRVDGEMKKKEPLINVQRFPLAFIKGNLQSSSPFSKEAQGEPNYRQPDSAPSLPPPQSPYP